MNNEEAIKPAHIDREAWAMLEKRLRGCAE